MFLYLGGKRRIIAVREKISEQAARMLEEKGVGVYYPGEFSFFMGEDKPGFEKAFYLETDGTIRIEYEPIPPRQPTPEEIMQAKLDYLMMMAE